MNHLLGFIRHHTFYVTAETDWYLPVGRRIAGPVYHWSGIEPPLVWNSNRKVINQTYKFSKVHDSNAACGCRDMVWMLWKFKHCTLSFKHYSQVENNFAQKHVFECRDGSGAVNGVVALEGFEEVGVGRLPVLLLCCMDDPCNRDDIDMIFTIYGQNKPGKPLWNANQNWINLLGCR